MSNEYTRSYQPNDLLNDILLSVSKEPTSQRQTRSKRTVKWEPPLDGLTPEEQNATKIIVNLLSAIGEDPAREGLRHTPRRVVKSWRELFAGYRENPSEILSTVFEDGTCEEMVMIKDIPFTSMCEHHMLPFIGEAHVAYLPKGKIVGLSKLARLVDCFARRLQIQEKMTEQIAKAIQEHLKPLGVAVIIEAHHQCMSCRGVKKTGTTMVTSSMLGAFKDKPATRAELLSLLK